MVVYTAIIGPYDELPRIRHPSSSIDYVCFTDQDIARDPWTILPVKSTLVDPKLTVNYLKCHAVELFPDHMASCWVDANFAALRLSAAEIRGLVVNGAVRTPPHPERRSALEELAEIRDVGLDDHSALARTGRFLTELTQASGDLVLPWTSLLLRDHTDQRVRDMGAMWWALVLSLSRRDQLTVGAAMRLSGVRWHPLRQSLYWYVEDGYHKNPVTRQRGTHTRRGPDGFPLTTAD